MSCRVIHLLLICGLLLDSSDSAIVTADNFTAAVNCSDLDLRCKFTSDNTETELYLTWTDPSGHQIYRMDFQSNNYTFGEGFEFAISKNNEFTTGDITFPKANVTKEMAGPYVCTFVTNATSVSATASIDVQYRPSTIYFSVRPPLDTIENADLVLTCHTTVSNPGAPIVFSWSGPGTITGTSQVLTVSRVKRTATGPYRCTGKTTLIPTRGINCIFSQSTHASITVFYHDSPTVSVSEVNPKENSAFVITCQTKSLPAASLSATRNNHSIQNGVRDNTTNMAIYKVQKVSCGHSGIYKCTSFNAKTKTTLTRQKTVNVLCKPRMHRTSSRTRTLKINQVARFEVTVVAYPSPNFSWFQLDSNGNHQRLQPNAAVSSSSLSSVLTINITSPEDYAIYTVVSNNSQGQADIANFTLKSDVKPFRIEKLSIVNTSVDSVFVQWLSPFDGGTTQTFSLQFASERDYSRSIWSTRHENLSDPGRYQNVTGGILDLYPGRTYFMRIVSTNSRGFVTSSVVNVTTVGLPGDQNGSTGAGIGIGIGICIFIALIALLAWFIYRHRIKPIRGKAETPDVRYANAAVHATTEETTRPSGSGKREDDGNETNPPDTSNATNTEDVNYESLSVNRSGFKPYDRIALKPNPELGKVYKSNTNRDKTASHYENLQPKTQDGKTTDTAETQKKKKKVRRKKESEYANFKSKQPTESNYMNVHPKGKA
ncbi:synaptogenesis protein syg-2-like [Gigantopelta aegis]|uniref:synaptogenesis protein syg-2-like n=1 Tax=Gigantopelta aegis TaxID=1735272 RepID=UPI001B887D2A|nr:synaptogenesis protein syg-2-like [Gigantopelta aegis]